MMDTVFAFVILHYNEPDVTKKCVDAIFENTVAQSIEIVIVDNCSPDGSGEQLEGAYQSKEHVTVLRAEKNLGFAKGNNIGYVYAKETLHADFICVMNNDVLLLQKDFIQRVLHEYEASHCGIIGPHITLLNGYTNYMYLKIHSRKYFEKEMENSKRMYRYYTSKLYPIRNCINRILDAWIPALKFHKEKEETMDEKIQMVVASKQRHKNIVLHGCCLILTPMYISKFEDAFNPSTFMFREEELLYLRCRSYEIDTIYEPTIDILHLEDMATNATYKKSQKREAFKFQCQIDSLQIVLEELK